MIDQEWLKNAVKSWGDIAKDPKMSIRNLAKQTGLSKHKAVKLIQHVRKPVPETNQEEPIKNTGILHSFDYYYNKETDTYVTFIKPAPKPIVLPGHVHRSMKQAYSNWDGKPATINQICRRFEIPRSWFEDYKRVHEWTHDSEPFTSEEILEKSVEDLVQDALQGRRQRLYQQYEIAKWKEIQRDADRWNQFEQETLNVLSDRLNRSASDYSVPSLNLKDGSNPYVLLVGLTDFHWGSYAWDKETYGEYNRSIAEKRLKETTERILNKLPYKPEEILLPIGSDFFDVDGDVASTTKGTPQDTDGTPTEILVTGCELARSYVDMLRQVAPVRIVMMSGNHDRHNGLALLLYLSAWYRNVDDVNVQLEYKPRVYLEYGNNLIAFSHGDGSSTKPRDLALIVATEAREAWGRTEHHFAFGGHLHHEKVEEHGGLVHYLMPSLSGTTRWAARNGHVDAKPSLQAFMINVDGGIGSVLTVKT